MSKNIKIELELPEFDEELNISLTLRKDGEVLVASSSLPSGVNSEISLPVEEKPVWKQEPEEVKSTVSTPRKKRGGNMMDLSI